MTYLFSHLKAFLPTADYAYSDTAVAVMRNSYNELGRRSLFRPSNESAVVFEYNLRGQLVSLGSRYLIQKLFYEEGGYEPCYNGNISSMLWRTYGMPSGEKWRYDYSYDTLDRLTEAYFSVEADQGVSVSKADYSTNYTYDLNSNLKSLNRKGPFSLGGNPEYGCVDNLTMTLDGNRIVSVKEGADEVVLEGSLDYPSANSDAIRSYDLCGRLIKDPAHGIERIHYNPAGQPIKIEMGDDKTFYMIYDADGRRIAYSKRQPSPIIPIHPNPGGLLPLEPSLPYPGLQPVQTHISLSRIFHGAVIYKDGELERINLPEGYITPNGTFNAYYYDYQGNVRAVGTGGEYGTPLQITHYYPYGLPYAEGLGASVNRYKYTGKELITEDNLNFYDFDARLQWPDLPAFNRPDPKEEDYTWLSPYIFCNANPIMYMDISGLESIYIHTGGKDDFGLKSHAEMINTSHIAISAHGHADGSGIGEISTGEDLQKVLEDDYGISLHKDSEFVLVLHSCYTGMGDNSFASKVSKYFHNAVVYAPESKLQIVNHFGSGTTTQKVIADENNSAARPYWGIFRKGNLVGEVIKSDANITKVSEQEYAQDTSKKDDKNNDEKIDINKIKDFLLRCLELIQFRDR